MIRIVLDISANTFKNNVFYFENMVKQIKAIDNKKYNIVFKAQLFSKDSEAAKINEILEPSVFNLMYLVCNNYNYELTASVFDKQSLEVLLHFDVPFIKIACRPDLYYLLDYIPNNIPVYISIDCREKLPGTIYTNMFSERTIRLLQCIPEYPAKESDYFKKIYMVKDRADTRYVSISDHTDSLSLFNYWKDNIQLMKAAGFKFPFKYSIFEMHYVLEHDDNNPDAGSFAKTIKDLKEIL